MIDLVVIDFALACCCVALGYYLRGRKHDAPLWGIAEKLDKIMATQAELTTVIAANTARLVKIGTETTTLIALVEELRALIAQGNVTPELQAAVEALAVQVGVVDDLVPDAPA